MSAIVRALSTPKPPFLIKAKRCCRREAGKEEGGEPGRAIAPTQGAGNGGRGAGGDGGGAAPDSAKAEPAGLPRQQAWEGERGRSQGQLKSTWPKNRTQGLAFKERGVCVNALILSSRGFSVGLRLGGRQHRRYLIH